MGVLDYLGSAKNLTGCALGVVAAAVTVPTGLAGDLWPVVVAAAYGIGAVAAPRGKSLRLRLGQSDVSVEDLKTALAQLRLRRVPAECQPQVAAIIAALDEIVPRWDTVRSRPDIAYDVTATIADYLPTTLDAYDRIPPDLRTRPAASGTSPQQDVIKQLGVLAEHLGGVRDAVYADDVAALQAQGKFLHDKYGRRALDMDQ